MSWVEGAVAAVAAVAEWRCEGRSPDVRAAALLAAAAAVACGATAAAEATLEEMRRDEGEESCMTMKRKEKTLRRKEKRRKKAVGRWLTPDEACKKKDGVNFRLFFRFLRQRVSCIRIHRTVVEKFLGRKRARINEWCRT